MCQMVYDVTYDCRRAYARALPSSVGAPDRDDVTDKSLVPDASAGTARSNAFCRDSAYACAHAEA